MLSIRADGLTVEFPLYDRNTRSLRHHLFLDRLTVGGRATAPAKRGVGGSIGENPQGRVVVRALDGVSFTLEEGDRVGVLGRNGSGKTTLLRTIAGIFEPIAGRLDIAGHVVPLFDISMGMDPDSTGLENIWLRGRMLGLDAATIDANIDQIAAFSDLGEYLYMPIRAYSAGMLVRLAFAVSTAVAPEILVLDEMIGAGDAAFVERAKNRLKIFIEKTGILVIASHSIEMLHTWCNKGLLLDKGQLLAFGPIDEVSYRYWTLMTQKDGPAVPAEEQPQHLQSA